MPVVTRSQSKNPDFYQDGTFQKIQPVSTKEKYDKFEFIAKLKKCLSNNSNAAIGKEKNYSVLETYKLINQHLPQLMKQHPCEFISLSIIIFNKSTDLLLDISKGKLKHHDVALVGEIRDEILKSRNLLMPLIRYCDEYSSIPAGIYITHR
jgi:hypothetical protein